MKNNPTTFLILLQLLLFTTFTTSKKFSVDLTRLSFDGSAPKIPRRTLGQASLPLLNYYNTQYYGKIYLGSSQKSFNVIFDTSSPWVWVPQANQFNQNLPATYSCSDSSSCLLFCSNGRSNHGCSDQDQDSMTYKLVSGQAEVTGYLAQDEIKLENITKGFNQTFLLCKDANVLNGLWVDGVFGLSFKSQDSSISTTLYKLQEVGIIEQQVFGLQLSDNSLAYGDGRSIITFGGIDDAYEGKNSTKVSIQNNYIFWTIQLDSLIIPPTSYSPTGLSKKIKLEADSAVIDSGIESIIMNWDDFRNFTAAFVEQGQLQCGYDLSHQYTCTCEDGDISRFPDIWFQLDGNSFRIGPEKYIRRKSDNCEVLIESGLFEFDSSNTPKGYPTSYIVLGEVFLRSYYSVFNATDFSITFYDSVSSRSANDISSFMIMYLIFAVFIVAMFLVFAVCLARTWLIVTPAKKSDAGTPLVERSLMNNVSIPIEQ